MECTLVLLLCIFVASRAQTLERIHSVLSGVLSGVLPCTARELDPTKHPNWGKLDQDTCGTSLENRIIGGKEAKVAQYPWLARIGISRSNSEELDQHKETPFFFCSGTVIHKRYIVTAGHCTINPKPITYIRLGDYNSKQTEVCNGKHCSAPTDYHPEAIIPHEKYEKSLPYDIALIRTTTDIKFTYFVMPLCLPSGELMSKNFTGELCEAAGWGIKNIATQETSETLLSLKIPILAQDVCAKEFKNLTTILPTQMCAGGVIGKDTCNGDSGGPLMNIESVGDSPPRYYLIGIVSYGDVACGNTTKPGIYTRVTKYTNWILDNIKV